MPRPPSTRLHATLPTSPARSANNVFSMFGALLFGIWVFYLLAATIKGNFKFGLNLLIFKVGGAAGGSKGGSRRPGGAQGGAVPPVPPARAAQRSPEVAASSGG